MRLPRPPQAQGRGAARRAVPRPGRRPGAEPDRDGDAGRGKSLRVYTLKEHVLGQMVEGEVDEPVIEWRCAPHFQNTGLYPAIEFLERDLGFHREEPPQARFDRLVQMLEELDLARPQTVPLWAALLSLPVPDRFPALALSPARQREETFRVLLEWLQ